MDRTFSLDLIRVTEAAALAAAKWMGKGDAISADTAAVRAMHHALNELSLSANIAIGEGSADERELLFVDETVGDGTDIAFDMAVDALECTKSVAFGRSNAMAVIAMAPKGDFFRPPCRYMEKIAVGPEARGAIDLNLTVEANLRRVADAKGYKVSDLTAVVLDRERHIDLITSIRKIGARVHLIPDGDVSAAIATAVPGSGIDLLMGTGGAAAGVLAAAALRCLGGEIHTRLAPHVQEESARSAHHADLRAHGKSEEIVNHTRVYRTEDLARSKRLLFAATGVTDGDILNGVSLRDNGATTHSMVLSSMKGTRRFIVTEHYLENHT